MEERMLMKIPCTLDMFKSKVYDLVKDEYEVVDDYILGSLKILMLHRNCGSIYKVTPNAFCGGSRCPTCMKIQRYESMKIGDDGFKNRVYELVGDEYTVLGGYKKSQQKLLMRHNNCNNEYLVKPHAFIHNGSRCPNCTYGALKTTEQFIKDVFLIHGSDYLVMGEYTGSNCKIHMKHLVCGNEYYATPNSITSQKSRCYICYGKNKLKNTEIFKNEVLNLVGEEYYVVGEYINSTTKIEIFHNICNTSYDISPAGFLQGKRCARCSESSGEVSIRKFLEINEIKYKRQFTFPDCKDKSRLKFDFAVLDNNGFPTMLIEFDGKQHYEPIGFFGGEKGFENTKRKDSIKTNYCIANNLTLLRIPHWDYFRIKEILIEEFEKYNIKQLSSHSKYEWLSYCAK